MNSKLPPTPDCMSEHTADPHEQGMAYLSDLVNAGVKLNEQEVAQVIDLVPLLVLADDDPLMRDIIFMTMTFSREKTGSIVKLEGDMEKCFEALPKVGPGQLPVVLCHDGAQAETATQIICDRQIGNGVLIFDHQMGFPHGLDIFKGLNGKFPAGVAKALFSGSFPQDTDTCIAKRIIDVAIPKPPKDMEEMRAEIAHAYLRKIGRVFQNKDAR